ncbi:MAG: hypothetical protein OXF89_04800 [Rhodospirillaceae bacterium]|nr:hypothetical protein [Rhodospirillaceae bacterium]
MAISFPVPEPRVMPHFGLLSTRQEAFSDRNLPPADREAPLRPAPGFGAEPDIRDDEEYIDGVESNWINDLRSGCEPLDPWPDVPPREDPFASAQDAPEQDDPAPEGNPEDDPAQEGRPEDDPAAPAPLAGPPPRAAGRHPGNGRYRAAAAALPPAAGLQNGDGSKPNGAAHDIS